MKKTLTALASATAALAILTACSDSSEKTAQSASSTSATTTATQTNTGEAYESSARLAKAINQSGLGCSDFTANDKYATPDRKGLSGSCQTTTGGTSVNLILTTRRTNANYTGAEQQDRARFIRMGLGANVFPTYYLEGNTWTVECTTPSSESAALAACEAIQKHLGGTVENQNGAPAS